MDKIKGSRFIADLIPVDSAGAAMQAVEAIRDEFPGASHHCWAYRIGSGGDESRFSDDGEPSGSAGRPILARIEGLELTDVVLIVTRYFGGTRLGVGGLVRAYGGAAAETIRRAPVRTVTITRAVTLTHGYELSAAVARELNAADLEAVEASYGETVRLRLELPVEMADDFLDRIREATGGQARIVETTKKRP